WLRRGSGYRRRRSGRTPSRRRASDIRTVAPSVLPRAAAVRYVAKVSLASPRRIAELTLVPGLAPAAAGTLNTESGVLHHAFIPDPGRRRGRFHPRARAERLRHTGHER